LYKIPGQRGLPSVFKTSLDWLQRQGRQDKCKYSWTSMYLSLSIIDPFSKGIPLSVLALMWEVSIQSAKAACQKLTIISLATLSPGDTADRKFKRHILQLRY
jgi:hypothetical protein